ncbi:hypothetical protein EI555_016561, partial [Monodon monoceros]
MHHLQKQLVAPSDFHLQFDCILWLVLGQEHGGAQGSGGKARRAKGREDAAAVCGEGRRRARECAAGRAARASAAPARLPAGVAPKTRTTGTFLTGAWRPGSGSSSGGSFRSGGPTAAVAAAPPPLRGSVPSPHTQTRRTAAAGGAVWALLPPPPQEHPARGDRKEALALSSVLVLLLPPLPPPPGITRAPPSQAAALVAMMMMSRTQPLGEGRRGGCVCGEERADLWVPGARLDIHGSEKSSVFKQSFLLLGGDQQASQVAFHPLNDINASDSILKYVNLQEKDVERLSINAWLTGSVCQWKDLRYAVNKVDLEDSAPQAWGVHKTDSMHQAKEKHTNVSFAGKVGCRAKRQARSHLLTLRRMNENPSLSCKDNTVCTTHVPLLSSVTRSPLRLTWPLGSAVTAHVNKASLSEKPVEARVRDACTTISDAAENAHRVFRVDKVKNNSGKEAGMVLNREGKSAGEDEMTGTAYRPPAETAISEILGLLVTIYYERNHPRPHIKGKDHLTCITTGFPEWEKREKEVQMTSTGFLAAQEMDCQSAITAVAIRYENQDFGSVTTNGKGETPNHRLSAALHAVPVSLPLLLERWLICGQDGTEYSACRITGTWAASADGGKSGCDEGDDEAVTKCHGSPDTGSKGGFPEAGAREEMRPPCLSYLGAAPRRGVLRRDHRKTPSGTNSPAAQRGARETAVAQRLQRWAPRRGRRCAGAPAAGVSAASPQPRGASPAAYLRCAQAPEPIHMVLSPPSSGAAEAAPVVPRRAREPARAAALCEPGKPSVLGLKRRAPGRRWMRGSECSLSSAPAAVFFLIVIIIQIIEPSPRSIACQHGRVDVVRIFIALKIGENLSSSDAYNYALLLRSENVLQSGVVMIHQQRMATQKHMATDVETLAMASMVDTLPLGL